MDDAGRRGRPRGFDAGVVLDQALGLFWRQGFAGTSYADLTRATGLNKPSLYAVFGDKEALFAATLDRYCGGRQGELMTAFAESPRFHAGLAAMLQGFAAHYAGGDQPCGCLIATSQAEARQPDFPPGLRAKLGEIAAGVAETISARVARAVAEAELPPGTDQPALVAFILSFGLGLASAARAGAPLATLRAAISVALGAIPGGGKA